MLAESAIRQLQSEMATTSALMGRPSSAAADPPAAEGSASLSRRVARIQDKLRGQTEALEKRLDSLHRDLGGFDSRVREFSTTAGDTRRSTITTSHIDVAILRQSPQSPPQSPPHSELATPKASAAARVSQLPLPLSTAPRQSLLRGASRHGQGMLAVSSARSPPSPPPPPPPPFFGAFGDGNSSSSGGFFRPLGADTALLIICFQRADYLRRSLATVKKHHPGKGSVPVVISQDGNHPGVRSVAGDFRITMARDAPTVAVAHLHHDQRSALGGTGYHKLAQHYGWALGQVFHRLNEHAPSLGANYMCQRVIILEEDLEIAPDFFGFFAATVPLLDDPNENLLAVSACKSVGRETQKLGNLCCSACGSLRLSQRA